MRKLVAAVIFRGNKFLILKRRLNWKGWEFVKGEVEKETYKQAVMREIREELGLKNVRIICKLPAEIVYHHEDIRGHTTSVQFGFLVEYIGGKTRLSSEHDRQLWADNKKAKKLLTYGAHKTFLRLAWRYIGRLESSRKKELIQNLSRKHVTLVRFDGKFISLKYDGKILRCSAVRRTVKDVGNWSRHKKIVYYDRNLEAGALLPILVHEMVERHVALSYGLDVDTEAHKIAQAVEKEFIADKSWIKEQRKVTMAWVKANKQKVGKAKFY